MSSNFHPALGASQNSGILSYSMKGLNLGSYPPHSSEISGGSLSPATLHYNLGITRPVSSPIDSGIANLIRQTSRGNLFSDYTTAPNPVGLRPPVLPNTNIGGANFGHVQNGIFGITDRIGTSLKPVDSDDVLGSYRVKPIPHTSSRVLSNLQESTPLPFNNNSNDITSAFLLNRFGSSGDRFSAESSHHRSDRADVAQSGLPNMNDFESALPESNALSAILASPPKSILHTLQSSLTNPTITVQPSKMLPEAVRPIKASLDHNGHSTNSTPYYNNRQLEETRDLQASGFLKSARWILVPPVPEGTASHMRTGRAHELKSRACSDRVFNAAYMDHELKQILQNKIQACLFTADESVKEKLPRNLGAYTDLVPLEVMNPPRVSVTFGLPCVCFKAWSPRFNRPMLLRRVVLPSTHEAALSPDAYLLAKQLSDLDHPSLVGFRDIFFTNAFSDNSAVVVYEYTPCSSTVQQTHMSDPMKLTSFSSPFNITRTTRPHSSLKSGPSELGMLPESTLWSYIVQLAHGLRFIHQTLQRSCGVLDPTKVLLQEGTRLRINCFGLKDILFPQTQDFNLADAQMSDLVQLGKLVIGAACGTAESLQISQRATVFNLLQRSYRAELVTLLRGLISNQISTIDQLLTATAPYVYDHLTSVTEHSDFLERQLFLNMECDRLFRLVCKLQSIVERNERNSSNPDWAETGDRYMLKLFRDFLFHQSDNLNAPYLDLAHVISTLNKVEAGSTDRLCLVSRDSQNAIIVTYAEIKQWLDTSFSHLVERQRQSRCEAQLAQQREARQKQAAESNQPVSTSSTGLQCPSTS